MMKKIPPALLWLVMISCALFFLPGLGFGQQPASTKTITGTVRSEKGEPLAGVTVRVKDGTASTHTDANGRYSLSAAAGNVLIFSSIGFKPQERPVPAEGSAINLVLPDEFSTLNDVIVVGYTSQKKATVTGATSSINSVDLVRTPAVAATSALVGKVAGVTFRATDSRPGNGTSLQIRNLGDPLYVIDGVPYSTNNGSTAFGFNTGISGQNLFNNLTIEDIESITVLKDASASIYGLRASNGVVLVTTKKGKRREQTSINFSSYYGLQNFTRYPRPANAGQYVRGQLEAAQNAGNAAPSDIALIYTPEQLAKWEAGTEKGYKSYDHFKSVTRPNVPQYYMSMNASGGSQRSNYYLSLSHMRQDAIIKDFNFQRTNLQANLNGSVAKGLEVGTEISARIEKRHNVGVPGLDDYFNPLLSISSMWPTEPLYANDNPNYINTGHSVNINPATYKDNITGYIDELFRAVNVNVNAQYTFKWGMVLKGLYSYNFTNEDFDGFEYTYNSYTYDPATDSYRITGGNQNPWREKHKRNIVSRFAQLQLSYNKQLGAHAVSAVAAYERSDMENDYLALHTVPPNDYIPVMQLANLDYLDDSWATEARAGYVGRINYNYKQKYLLEMLGRYDGSFLYAPDKRWGFFPGVSLGWRISQEPFFQDSRLNSVVTDLKIRASYGQTGSELGLGTPPTMFTYLSGYNFNQGSAVLNGTYVNGIRPRGLPITNLSWVVNHSKNIGIDVTLLRGKITGQFDVFERLRSGLPAARYDVLLPNEVGYGLPLENLNKDATRGMDGMITYQDKAGDFNYSIGINGTIARRRDISSYKPRFGSSWDEYRNSYENRWGNINWGYEVIGRFQSQQEIDNYKVNNDEQGNRTQLPGDFIYKDVNGDGIINYLDERPIGYAEGALPYFTYGINGNLQWKGFNLAFDFAGAGMQSYFRDWELRYPFQNNGNSPAYMLSDRWHRADPYNPFSEWIPGKFPATRKGGNNNTRRNDFWVTNVRYLRLKTLELGYSFPQKLLKRTGISKLRVYASASNLFSIDNLSAYQIDPEVASSNGLIYPQQKLYLFGFNLSL